ncbi:MAG: hypothetical protein AAF098_19950, partial [Pseudomonadota bacterium]
MEHGFIHPVASRFVSINYWLNAVEIIKALSIFISKKIYARTLSDNERRSIASLVIDAFVISKFLLVFLLIMYNSSSP